MKAYFLNITEEEKNSIKDKHSKPYDGYVTRGNNVPNETRLNVGNYALDTEGVTVNNQGDVMEYKNKDINMKLKKTCNECGGLYEGTMCEQCSSVKEGEQCEQCGTEIKEGEQCEQCATKAYTMEELEENIKLKSKAPLVSEQISESLSWSKKLI
jgi:hypothetical protein